MAAPRPRFRRPGPSWLRAVLARAVVFVLLPAAMTTLAPAGVADQNAQLSVAASTVAPAQLDPDPAPGAPPTAPDDEADQTDPEPSPGPPPPADPQDDPDKDKDRGGDDGDRDEKEPKEPGSGEAPRACEVDPDVPCETDGSLFDIPGMVTDAIASFFGRLVDSLAKPLKKLLADTLLATPDVTTNPVVKKVWKASLGITLAVYVLFVLAGGITVMGYESVQSRYALKQIAPRLVLGLITAVASLTVLGKTIALANAVSTAVMTTSTQGTGKGLMQQLLSSLRWATWNPAQLHLILLALVFWAMALGVVLGYIIRVAIITILAVCAPLVLACHALPQTEPLAKLWWRAVTGMLLIQLAQSFTLIVAVLLFFAPDNTGFLGLPNPGRLTNLLAGLCLIWVLLKIPGWIARIIFRATPITGPGNSRALRTIRGLAIMMLLRGGLPSRATTGPRTPTPIGHQRPSGSPPPTGGGPGGGPGGGGPGGGWPGAGGGPGGGGPSGGGPGGGGPSGGVPGGGGPGSGAPGNGGPEGGGPGGGPPVVVPTGGGSDTGPDSGPTLPTGGSGGPPITFTWAATRRNGPQPGTGGQGSGHPAARASTPTANAAAPAPSRARSSSPGTGTPHQPPSRVPPPAAAEPPSTATGQRRAQPTRPAPPPPPVRRTLPPGRPLPLRLPLEPPRTPSAKDR